ncbi:UbiA prenyltransferase family-domain-containing protein [Elsinoe ampelina]|uniref:4-hydroxybenzoate polyprenyltransferase, mitochondrial n=1 Tax=Elsinoe ampelina TaxID=302913 RepID=A0A6A6GD54_9PEZI|nr:UbiA prenyltransferase family-domain-containing protein [Elsinoe ampelina]
MLRSFSGHVSLRLSSVAKAPKGDLPNLSRRTWTSFQSRHSCSARDRIPTLGSPPYRTRRPIPPSLPRQHPTPFRSVTTSTGPPTTTTTDQNNSPPSFPTTYHPPTTGLLSHLPPSLIPYAELSRLDKPIGTYYLLLPCIFSTLLAAPLTSPPIAPSSLLTTTLLFISGSLIMRGAGCTINDIWDRNLDPHVARTRLRPLARGAVSLPSAVVWTGVQLLSGLAVLLQFPAECFYYATPSLLLVGLYPAAKRVTNYPQFVLGLTFSWGAIMGFPALGVDLLADQAALWAAAALYGSNVAWTVLYDMVYAHMDLKDDKRAGIRSIARAHEGETKAVLAGLAVVQAGLLGVAGAVSGAGWVYHVGVVGGSLVGNGLQIWKVRLEDAASCWWWFRKGVWITGGTIVVGMGAEYAVRYLGLYDTDKNEEKEVE